MLRLLSTFVTDASQSVYRLHKLSQHMAIWEIFGHSCLRDQSFNEYALDTNKNID